MTNVGHFTIVNTPDVFPRAIAAAMMTASADEARGAITVVKFDSDAANNSLVMTSTDSYCLSETTLTGVDIGADAPASFLIRRGDLARYVKIAAKRSNVRTLHVADGVATFDGMHPETAVMVPVADVGEFPKTDQLWQSTGNVVTSNIGHGGPVCFNPDYLARICQQVRKLAGTRDAGAVVTYRGGETAVKAHAMHARGDGWSYRAILMPVRATSDDAPAWRTSPIAAASVSAS